jgi:hypothetical protein
MASDSRRGRIVVITIVLASILGAIAMTLTVHVSTSDYVKHLDSNDPDTVAYALVILKDRNTPAGADKAETLLKNDTPQIWINAAIYLGSLNKPESIPYLIKALPQADLDQGIQIVQLLTQLTHQPFNNDVNAWQSWWKTQPHSP